jgi:uncharacterized membrane protein YgdD (TMEM256/DUF423 family)
MIVAGSINLFIAVAAGAFGAHALKQVLNTEMLAIWQTGAQYQVMHGLGLLLLAALADKPNATWSGRAAWAMLIGIALFSGSLYLLALTGQRWLGAITPFGGLSFLAAWAMLAWAGRLASSK